jgi:hypothetical protein
MIATITKEKIAPLAAYIAVIVVVILQTRLGLTRITIGKTKKACLIRIR